MPESKNEVPNKIVLRKHIDYTIDSEATLNLGRTFAGRIDNFFGNIVIKAGETDIDGRKVRAIATSKDKNTVEILVGDAVLTLQLNINPLADAVNSIFADLFWANAGVISDYASQDEVQGNRHYALKDITPMSISLVPKESGNIYDIYESAHNDVRKFIMERIGDLKMSWEEASGERAFPSEIDETWLRNRFLQTSAFLGEVFAFPDDLTREVFLSAFLARGGSCLLSGIPGTGKSVIGDEPVLVRENGMVKSVLIGEYINGKMELPPSGKTDILVNNENIEVLTLDNNNKVRWRKLKAMSRHHYNRDILKIRTRSGRLISATDDHSFVIQKSGDILVVDGNNIKKGQVIPVVKEWHTEPISISYSDNILSRTEFIYGSDVSDVMNDIKGLGEIPTPITMGAINQYISGRRPTPNQDRVYSKSHKGLSMPECIRLDDNLGYVIGSYLAEGYKNNNALVISNDNEYFIDRLVHSSERIGCNPHIYRYDGKCPNVILNNDIFATYIGEICGFGSANKTIPEFAYSAPTEFVRSLLRSYFDGDGYVSAKENAVCSTTKSEGLAHGLSVLLSRFGIPVSIREKRIRSGKYSGNVYYIIVVSAKFVPSFNSKIGFGISHKKDKAERVSSTYNNTDMIINFGNLLKEAAMDCGINNPPHCQTKRATKRQRIGRTLALRYATMFESINPESENVKKWRRLVDSDVLWDEVVAIERMEYNDYVYDFEVDSDTNTFVAGRGMMVVHNTKLTDLATVLLFNGYGYAGYEYKAPVQDRVRKKVPKYIYTDLSGMREEKEKINIITVPPTAEQMKGRQWTILENIPTTSDTEIVSFEPDDDQINAFIETMKKKYSKRDIIDDINAMKSTIGSNEKIWIGGYKGPKHSQKFSINRTGTYARRWNDERFDQNLLKGKTGSEGGILMNDYYTKSLLRKVVLNDSSKWYVTDVAYDTARYPDTGERVDWEEELAMETHYLEFEPQLNEPGGLKEQRSKATSPEDKAKNTGKDRQYRGTQVAYTRHAQSTGRQMA